MISFQLISFIFNFKPVHLPSTHKPKLPNIWSSDYDNNDDQSRVEEMEEELEAERQAKGKAERQRSDLAR